MVISPAWTIVVLKLVSAEARLFFGWAAASTPFLYRFAAVAVGFPYNVTWIGVVLSLARARHRPCSVRPARCEDQPPRGAVRVRLRDRRRRALGHLEGPGRHGRGLRLGHVRRVRLQLAGSALRGERTVTTRHRRADLTARGLSTSSARGKKAGTGVIEERTVLTTRSSRSPEFLIPTISFGRRPSALMPTMSHPPRWLFAKGCDRPRDLLRAPLALVLK